VARDRRKEGGSTVWLAPPVKESEWPSYVLVLLKGKVEQKLDHLGFQCDSIKEVDTIDKRAAETNV